MSKIGLIIEREYLTRVYKKSFIIMTLLIPLVFVALAIVPALLSQIKGGDIKTVAVLDETGKYGSVLKDKDEYRFVTVKDANQTPLNYYKSKDDDQLYAVLMISGNLLDNPKQITLFSEKTVNMSLKEVISSQFDEYLTQEKINSYNIPDLQQIIDHSKIKVNLETVKWSETGEESESSADIAAAIGFVATFLIYMFIFAYGGMVMNGVMQEKTNRIVEVMVSSVKPFQLMMGKIIGVGLVGLTQFLIWVVIIGGVMIALGMGTMMSTDMSQLSVIDPTMTTGVDNDTIQQMIQSAIHGVDYSRILLFFIIYFVGGYLLYASLFAAIASMVDQDADTQQFMIPITMIILFAFYAAVYSIENPDGPLAFWCSIIPFTSPIVMMVRLPYDVPAWQLILSIALLFITFIVGTYFAAKIYRTGILMYGKKITYKEVIKWLKYKN